MRHIVFDCYGQWKVPHTSWLKGKLEGRTTLILTNLKKERQYSNSVNYIRMYQCTSVLGKYTNVLGKYTNILVQCTSVPVYWASILTYWACILMYWASILIYWCNVPVYQCTGALVYQYTNV